MLWFFTEHLFWLYSMIKSVVIALIYFLVFCGIYYKGFSIKLVKITHDSEVHDLLATDSHANDL